jgi:hypothetical protein
MNGHVPSWWDEVFYFSSNTEFAGLFNGIRGRNLERLLIVSH